MISINLTINSYRVDFTMKINLYINNISIYCIRFFSKFFWIRSWVNAVSVDITSIGTRRDGHEEGEKEEDFEGDSILTIAQWERGVLDIKRIHSRARFPRSRLRFYLRISNRSQKKRIYIKRGRSFMHTEFWRKNRWKPIDIWKRSESREIKS